MSKYTELKRLAEAATYGPWKYWGEVAHEVFSSISGTRVFSISKDAKESDAEFVAAANPSVVLALIDENENLAGCDKAYAEAWEKARSLQSEMDEVLAERDALRKDAERYQWVIRHADEIYVSPPGMLGKNLGVDSFEASKGGQVKIRVDAEIDAFIAG